MDIKTIILIWLIGLVLFIFYCVFRLKYIKEKYDTITAIPTFTTQNILNYLDKQKAINNIIDLPGCELVYDDNIAVNRLGYSNCQDAFSDYLSKGYDFNNKYGQDKSLADICPVSTKSDKYMTCLQNLLNNKTDNNGIMDGVTTDMTNSINKRLNDRLGSLNEIRSSLVPFVYQKDNVDFVVDMALKNQLPQSQNDKLPMVDKYYKGRYEDLVEKFQTDISAINVDAMIEQVFFGRYRAIKGQYKLFDDINIVIQYATPKTDDNPTPEIDLIVSNDDTIISFAVNSIKYYQELSNTIKINLSNKKIMKQGNNTANIDKILNILGLGSPSQLLLSYEIFNTADNKKKLSFKLVNDNLDTILILERL